MTLWSVTLDGQLLLDSDLTPEDVELLAGYVGAFLGGRVPDIPLGWVPWNPRDQRTLYLAAVSYAGELAADPLDVTWEWKGEPDQPELPAGTVQ